MRMNSEKQQKIGGALMLASFIMGGVGGTFLVKYTYGTASGVVAIVALVLCAAAIVVFWKGYQLSE